MHVLTLYMFVTVWRLQVAHSSEGKFGDRTG